jgi:hypothetical protein
VSGIVVTGRPEHASIAVGKLLRLHANGTTHEVVVRDIRNLCVRGADPKVAEVGLNTSLVLDGAPDGVALPGLWLSSE